jgi:hypothetical protein
LAAFGVSLRGNVEDRRGEPIDPYFAMLAFNDLAGTAWRHLIPGRNWDLPHFTPQRRSHETAGRLTTDAGYYDMPR